MAYQLPVKYFNSFWLKKVIGDPDLDPQQAIADDGGVPENESTVTTSVYGGQNQREYYLPTWPGLPWGSELSLPNPADVNVLKNYPCFPWGGRDWSSYTSGNPLPACEGGSLLDRTTSLETGKERCWFVEEARIRGGFNNTSVDFGVKAYAVEEDNLQQHRFNTLIYSGLYNSRTGINNTNVFSTADGSITVSLSPNNGSVQKLYAYNTNLTIFQENKVSKALIDKDAIYSAEGAGTPVTSAKVVIGQIVPYGGEFGISTNPESWAQYGFRQYFADRFRNAVLRLSRDGITEISRYGLTDFFRDTFSTITSNQQQNTITFSYLADTTPDTSQITFEIFNTEDCDCSNIKIGSLLSINGIIIPDIFVVAVDPGATTCLITTSKRWDAATYKQNDWPESLSFVTYNKDKIVGGYDTYNQNYVISVQDFENSSDSACSVLSTYNTLNFDEAINGWVSFYSYKPVFIDSLKNNFFSSDSYSLYQHYVDSINNRGVFYGERSGSSIEFIFNPNPSMVKNFQTINYEGTNGWQVDYFLSDSTEMLPYPGGTNLWYPVGDETNFVYSLEQGRYTSPITQMNEHAGFYRKENLYCSNLVNKSAPFAGEVVFGGSMTGIKGYFATVRLSTDELTTDNNGNTLEPTDLGGMKELYAVTSSWVRSSN